jgi:hypothetical protein
MENLADPVLQITQINENQKQLFPIGMEMKTGLTRNYSNNMLIRFCHVSMKII